MNQFTTAGFWFLYRRLPKQVRSLADKCFDLQRADPRHPSLRLKRFGPLWSARIGLGLRALAKERADGLVWFWIGPHDEYDDFLKSHQGAR